MSVLRQLNDSGVLGLIQTLAVVGTLYYTAGKVRVATEQVKATTQGVSVAANASMGATIERLTAASRDLQLRAVADKELVPILLGKKQLTPDRKRAVFISIVMNHYATIFDLHELGQIPKEVWEQELQRCASLSQ